MPLLRCKDLINTKIVILVNENTASAAEILACSLQDNNKATITDDGSSIKLNKNNKKDLLNINIKDGNNINLSAKIGYRKEYY